MKPSASICLMSTFFLSACESARYPNHFEFFEGQAFMSVSASSVLPTLQGHIWELSNPVNEGMGYCVVPTTDSTVQAVNDYIRKGRPLAPQELYTQEVFAVEWFFAAVGSYRPDFAGIILFDSHRRMVTVGDASRDFDGNYFELPYQDHDEVSTIDRLINIDSVWRKCEEFGSVFNSLPPL